MFVDTHFFGQNTRRYFKVVVLVFHVLSVCSAGIVAIKHFLSLLRDKSIKLDQPVADSQEVV